MSEKIPPLSSFGAQVVKARALTGKIRLRDWLPILRELEAFDLVVEAKYSFHKSLMWVFIVVAVVSLFGLFSPIPYKGLLTICLIASGSCALVFMSKANQYKAQDLHNDMRLSVLPFLVEIQEDIARKAAYQSTSTSLQLMTTKTMSALRISPRNTESWFERTLYIAPAR